MRSLCACACALRKADVHVQLVGMLFAQALTAYCKLETPFTASS